ncbi:hypothetical protein AcV7_004481 [Taiwanofungus camphoratus]|nr:hypothetical protein AcV7_004481 [Antrodia cinnamomea]
MVPNLPPELYDRIIDHLHDDRAALAACSLASRAFLQTARYHRFAHTVLDPVSATTFHPLLLASLARMGGRPRVLRVPRAPPRRHHARARRPQRLDRPQGPGRAARGAGRAPARRDAPRAAQGALRVARGPRRARDVVPAAGGAVVRSGPFRGEGRACERGRGRAAAADSAQSRGSETSA